ncbi:MAG: hypothetical protein WCE93_01520 [Nitrososphaeraceae archaeon]
MKKEKSGRTYSKPRSPNSEINTESDSHNPNNIDDFTKGVTLKISNGDSTTMI